MRENLAIWEMHMDVMLTQIKAPDTSRHFVRQPRLARIVQQRTGVKLVLIVAPPGYGKTAFISSMVNTSASRGRKCAWISLGRQDNNERRFWNLVCTALESSSDAFHLPKPLSPADTFDPYDTIAAIVNQASERARTRFYLALDNFHFIFSNDINDQVSSLIENAPKNLTVIIASDCLPAFPIATLRLEEDLVEIYADDLRFRLDETEYYLNESLRLGLSAREVKNVHHATRGWPAGLQMARMAYTRGLKDSEVLSFVEEKRSAFFIDAVVARKTEEMRAFLLKISHLPRISPLLAEYVTGMPQAGALLTEIERDELFAEVSHESPPWYAFSKTFRDALHQKALQTMPPATIRMLHQRAGEWFEKNGEPILAIEFALKAHTPNRIADIVADNMMSVAAQSQGESLATILQQVSLDGRLDASNIGTITSWAYCTAGKPRQALHWATLARTALDDGHSTNELVFIDSIEARANSLLGKFDQAITMAERTLATMNEGGEAAIAPWLYLTVRHTLGESYSHLGNYQLSIEHLSYCVDMAVPSGRPVVHYLATCELSELQSLLGHWEKAEQLARTALRSQRIRLAEAPWSLALVQVQLATLLLYGGNLDEAEDMAMRARRRLANQSNDDGRLCLLLLEAQLSIAQGEREEAIRTLHEVLRFAASNSIPRGKSPTTCAQAVQHLLFLGDYSDAYASLESLLDGADARDPHATVLIEITCASFSLFNGNPEDALFRAENALELCKAYEFLVPSAQARILISLAQSALKDVKSSISSLLDASAILAPHGITFPFVAAGNRAGALIEQALAHCASASHAFQREKAAEIAFLRRCANLMSDKGANAPSMTDSSLTQRELQVYHLLQSGKSRREIAIELGIAYNTVRVHVSNIYKKTQAGDDAARKAKT